jgi:hypothetical protein
VLLLVGISCGLSVCQRMKSERKDVRSNLAS